MRPPCCNVIFYKNFRNERLIFFEALYHTSCQDSYETGDNVPVTRSRFHHVFGSRNQYGVGVASNVIVFVAS